MAAGHQLSEVPVNCAGIEFKVCAAVDFAGLEVLEQGIHGAKVFCMRYLIKFMQFAEMDIRIRI